MSPDTRKELLKAKIDRIRLDREKILDDFAKAYIAENLQNERICDLVLCEKYENDTHKWWFEVKK